MRAVIRTSLAHADLRLKQFSIYPVMIAKYFLLWLPMVGLAFVNAAMRQLMLMQHFNELRAHQLSTVTLIVFCAIYHMLIFPFLHLESGNQALLVGLLWTVLTVLFEFSLGRLLKHSWTELFQQYNFTTGYIWPCFLLFLLLFPFLLYFFKR